MNYRSYRDLSLAISRNLHKIPWEIDLVVGIPRSGMLPATMIGQMLNKPVVALDSYIDGKIYEMGLYRRPAKPVTRFSELKHVLIMDDSINSGRSMNRVKQKICNSTGHSIKTTYGAVYYVRDSLGQLDVGLEECPWPRIFQWNILNSWVLAHACLDIDGVVCVDPTEEQNDDGDNYRDFLQNARPLYLTEFPISCFVTSRLEKYRDLTEEWLRRNNLRYSELIMLDLPSKQERLKQSRHAAFKAEVYQNRNEGLFIESNLSQAIQICKLTGKWVFCTETMEMIGTGNNSTGTRFHGNKHIPAPRIDVPGSAGTIADTSGKPASTKDKIESGAVAEVPVTPHVRKILFVNHSLAPFEFTGTPLSTLNHARGMMAKGLDVAVLIADPAVRQDAEKCDLDGMTLYRMPRADQEESFFPSASADDVLRHQQIILQILQDFRPDIIHINDYLFMPPETIRCFACSGVPVVRNICNTEEICFRMEPVISSGRNVKACNGPSDMGRCAECYCRFRRIDPADATGSIKKIFIKKYDYLKGIYAREVSAVIFTTHEFKSYFTSFVPIPEERIRVIPRGFSFPHARPSRPLRADGNVVKFGFLGSGISRKGIDVILRALEQLAGTKNFEFHFFGDIANEPFIDWIDELNKKHADRIFCRGAYAPEDLPKIVSEIHCAVIPSYFETYNRVIREMLWSGVPVIATDFFGSSIIENGLNGYRIACGDGDALADRMSGIIASPGTIEALSRGALRTSVPSLDDEIEALLSVYQDLYSNRGEKSLSGLSQHDEIFDGMIDAHADLDESYAFLFATLYVDTGNGFNEEESLKRLLPSRFDLEPVTIEFNLKDFRNIRALRLDPIDNAPAGVDVIRIALTREDGERVEVPVEKANAADVHDNRYLFTTRDPALYLSLPEQTDTVRTIQAVLKYSAGQEYVGLLERAVEDLKQHSSYSPLHAKLYIDRGEGFSENSALIMQLPLDSDSGSVSLTFPLRGVDPIRALRFDPVENAAAIVEISRIELHAGRLVKPVHIKESNAECILRNRYAFTTDDPSLHLEVPRGMEHAESLVIEAAYSVRGDYVNAIGSIVSACAAGNCLKDPAGRRYFAKLSVDSGSGFAEGDALLFELSCDPKTGRIGLDIDLTPYQKIKALRWDPIEHAAPVVELNQLQVYRKGKPVRASVSGTNAKSVCDNILIFASDDPHLEITLPADAPAADRLHIEYRVLVRNN